MSDYLKISELSVCHSKQSILQGINMDIKKGEIVAISGPSGSGKTTLLQAIAGLERDICQGEISVEGRIINKKNHTVRFKENKIAMVFQDHGLFPHMNVYENITFFLNKAERKNKEIKAYIKDLIEELQLSEMQKRCPHQISGGQCQRVSLARALAMRPDILLLDEPFASQDIELKKNLIRKTLKVIRKKEITALITTHDRLEHCFMNADHEIILKKGILVQSTIFDKSKPLLDNIKNTMHYVENIDEFYEEMEKIVACRRKADKCLCDAKKKEALKYIQSKLSKEDTFSTKKN